MAVSHEDVANFSTLNFANDLSRRNDVGLTFHTLHGQEGKERERERECVAQRGVSRGGVKLRHSLFSRS